MNVTPTYFDHTINRCPEDEEIFMIHIQKAICQLQKQIIHNINQKTQMFSITIEIETLNDK